MQAKEKNSGSHRSLPRRSQRDRLIALARMTIRGEATEPRGHLEIVLSRIRPEPTPLPEIQRGKGLKFISDPQARIHYLRKKFGFVIENRIDRSVSPALSFYWLVLGEDGGPKMLPVEYAAEKTGKPKTKKPKIEAAMSVAAPLTESASPSPAALFDTSTMNVWRDPEKGGQR